MEHFLLHLVALVGILLGPAETVGPSGIMGVSATIGPSAKIIDSACPSPSTVLSGSNGSKITVSGGLSAALLSPIAAALLAEAEGCSSSNWKNI